MLDVHPPHHAAHSWRDFFIHIATIVIGLLIAIGLEQTVEYVHHREQIKQTRESLDLERRQNIIISQENAVLLRREQERYSGNLAALRFIKAHPHADLKDLPAPIQWGVNREPFHVAAWKSLRGGPIAALLPAAELQANETLYRLIENIDNANLLLLDSVSHASQYQFTTSDPRELSPADLDAVIQSTLELLTKHHDVAVYLENLCDGETSLGFKPCLPRDEIYSWHKTVKSSDFPSVYGAVGQARVERNAVTGQELDKLDIELNALGKQN